MIAGINFGLYMYYAKVQCGSKKIPVSHPANILYNTPLDEDLTCNCDNQLFHTHQ